MAEARKTPWVLLGALAALLWSMTRSGRAEAAPAEAEAGPPTLKVHIRGEAYYRDDAPVTLGSIIAAFWSAAGGFDHVAAVAEWDATFGAVEQFKTTLTEAGIPWTLVEMDWE